MSQLKKFVLLLALISLPIHVSAEEATITYWDELAPLMDTIEDPFTKLDPNQLFDMATLARYRDAQKDPNFKVSDESKAEIVEITKNLEAQGVEIEPLFEARITIMKQREKLATLPNTTITDSERKVPGFITPIEMDGMKVTKFFLVPTAGACIHTPPPPPNQLILVDYPEGIELVSLSTPVWVSGTLKSEASKENVNYADGASNVESIYSIQASEVELYQP